jgi:hypothetical protein
LGFVETIIANGKPELSPEEQKLVAFVGALATWRTTQGVYSFDPTTFDALWKTPVTGEIPTRVLYHLPEWCVYIPTPAKTWRGNPLNGFFAHLEWNLIRQGTDLRLLLDVSRREGKPDEAVAFPVHMGVGGIAESLEESFRVPLANLPFADDLTDDNRAEMKKDVPALVSLVLYLCSECAEIRPAQPGSTVPGNPRPVKTKKGLRIFPPDRPNKWEVGYRLGAALRRAMSEHHPVEGESTGTHGSPRPHVRRAHWHTFWVGHRDQPESRIAILRWLHPILVNVQDVLDLTTTVREVTHV